MRERGYLCQVVEHWNSWARIRQDLFGFIDVLCLKDGEVVGVQATSASHAAERARKIGEHENVGRVRKAGIRIEVHGWRKARNGRWECRTVDCS